MAVDVAALLKVYRQLRSDRAPFEPDWRELASFIQPRKGSAIGKQPTLGERQTRRLYDSTAIHANRTLANTMHGTLTSPALRWFRFTMRNDELNGQAPVKQWLDECGRRVYAALGQSNWNAENLEVFLDLGAFGTGALFVSEMPLRVPRPGFPGVLFRSLPIGTYVIAEDAEGRVDTLFYTFTLAADALRRRFGEKALNDRLARLAADKPTEMVELIHAIVPRPDGVYGSVNTKKPWASCYLSERDKHVLEESGYDLFPASVPRWEKASGETYGRGPGHVALPDILTLNAMTRMELEAVALAIKPPLGARDHGVVGAIRWVPGGVTTIRDKDSLIPFESGAKYQVGQIKSEQLKASIKEMFYNNQLTLPTAQPMTATEIERRYELLNRVLGPTVGRIEFEHTNVVAMRVFAMMLLMGALPAPPPELAMLEPGQDHLDVISEGPLARSQKGSEVLAIERSLQIILPMAQSDPAVLDVMKMDEAARVVMESSNVPAKVFASDQEIQATRTQRAQAQQAEQQMQQAERMAGLAKSAAPALKAVAPAGLVPPTNGTGPGAGMPAAA